MPTKCSRPLPLQPWIRWQRSRSYLKVGAASSYLALWFVFTSPLKTLHTGGLVFLSLVTIFWGYISYRGIKTLDHHIITPLGGLLWTIWMVLALLLFSYTIFRKSPHFP